MRKKILERLQAKKAGSLKKLSQKGIEILLDKLEAKVQTEDDIDSTIDDLDNSTIPFDDIVELIQKESDRKGRAVRTALERDYDLTKKKKADEDDDEDDDEPGKPNPKKSGQQDVSKLIADEIQKALAPFASLAGDIQKNKVKEGLKVKLKEKGVPEGWADDLHVGDDFNEDDTVTRLETKWNEAKQLAVNQSIGDGSVIKGNSNSSTSTEQAIKDYAKSKAPAADSGYNVVKEI